MSSNRSSLWGLLAAVTVTVTGYSLFVVQSHFSEQRSAFVQGLIQNRAIGDILSGIQLGAAGAAQVGGALGVNKYRVLIFGFEHVKQFYGLSNFWEDTIKEAESCALREGFKPCAFHFDPDIPREVDTAVLTGGNPVTSVRLLSKLTEEYRKLNATAPRHVGNYYTEAYQEYRPKAFNYRVAIAGNNPEIRLVEGCRHYQRIIDALKNGTLDLKKVFDRQKGAASFVSNCAGERTAFLRNMSKLHRIDHWGTCLRNVKTPKSSGRGQRGWSDTKVAHAREYRFLFAMENKRFPFYISEKIFGALAAGCIPIFFGDAAVSQFVPPNSFINIPAYTPDAPAQLAALLSSLERNRTLFEQYLQWGVAEVESLQRRHRCERHWTCRVCDLLTTTAPDARRAPAQ